MSNSYTLDQLRADMDMKYAPVEIDLGKGKPVQLRHLLRLPADDRKAVRDAVESVNSEDTAGDATLESIRTIIRTVADRGDELVTAIGDDLALGMHITELWMGATQPGEAENSPA